MTINQLCKRSHANAQAKGFYDDIKSLMKVVKEHGSPEDQLFLQQIWLSHRLMLVVTELAEGLEAIRDRNFNWRPKSGGLGEEIADAKIRLGDLLEHTYPDVDAEEIVDAKMSYNATRPPKHGRSL